jgi:hypothetical protein
VFIGIDPALARPLPTIHCYLFSREKDFITDAYNQVCRVVRYQVDRASVSVHDVRNVAPHKEMLCVSFKLPAAVAQGRVQESWPMDVSAMETSELPAPPVPVSAAAAAASADEEVTHRTKRVCGE